MKNHFIILYIFLSLSSLKAQDNLSKRDSLVLYGKTIGYIEKIVMEKSLDANVRTFYIKLLHPVNSSDLNFLEDSLSKDRGNCYFKYTESFDKVNTNELCGFYLMKSADCKNTSLTFAIVGIGVGGALAYLVNPLVGIGVTGLGLLVSVIKNYQGNYYLNKSGSILLYK
jgi:hypothetical protein